MSALLTAFFLNPLFLLGVLTAGIPLIIHLIYKKKAPKVLFSTLRFLRISVERTSHRQKIQDLLLLLLRMALFALLAIALARPFIRSGALFKGRGAGAAVAIILDNSYSMACMHEGVQRYQRAKEAAQALLKGFGRNDFVALIFTGGEESARSRAADKGAKDGRGARYAELTKDHDVIYDAIVNSEVSSEQANMLNALNRVNEIFNESKEPNKEVYILTDLQENAWRGFQGGSGEFVPLPPQVPIILVNCGREDYKNLAVTEVSVRSRGRAVGVPVTIEAKVFNSTASPERAVVALYVAKEKRQSRSVEVEPGAMATVSFSHIFTEAGPQTGTIVLESDDSLALDNKREFKVDIAQRIRVLMLTDRKAAVDLLSDSFYLASALDPFRGSSEVTKSVIEPVEKQMADIDATVLKQSPVAFALDVGEFTRKQAQELAKYVEEGGNLVMFCGGAVSADNYKQMLFQIEGAKEGQGLLPALIGPAVGDADNRDQFARLVEVDLAHPIFQAFKAMPMSFFERVHVYRSFTLEVPHGSPARILATMDDARPFLVEKPFGRGKVMLCCTTAGSAWSNLPVTPFYLPFLHQIVYSLTASSEQKGEYAAGSPVRFPLPGGAKDFEVQITDPLGRTRRVGQEAKDEKEKAKDAAFLVFEDTHATGVYSYHTARGKSESAADVFVVNPDPEEANLKSVPQEEVRKMLASDRVYFASDLASLQKVTLRLREGFQLWNFVLFVVLGIAVFECFFANKSKPDMKTERRYGLQLPQPPRGAATQKA
ncbi:MAG: VWA domain-containing protein [Planctomycetes bacterium]|nr:VWA domain-containing protein [Planctomycetota bacterium]MBM4078101.1 VWA domain-containing protein [Planctomycetota bacterium]MBM4083266.1 VWA domain-containing protein [Planctomycetota bacterium]